MDGLAWPRPDWIAERDCAGWRIEHHERLASTQVLARERSAWSAVIASYQTAGHGTRQRHFVSDAGGLYLTAVLPYDGDARRSQGFALAVGWALRTTLRRAGVRGLRLRWPNDLMIGRRKVGGILVEQAGPDRLLVGIGLNVTNQPWQRVRALEGVACRLADHMPCPPTLERLEELVLRAIRAAHVVFARRGLTGFVPLLNRTWGRARPIEVDLAFGSVRGVFGGLNQQGAVLVRQGGATLVIGAHRIDRLKELDPTRRLRPKERFVERPRGDGLALA